MTKFNGWAYWHDGLPEGCVPLAVTRSMLLEKLERAADEEDERTA